MIDGKILKGTKEGSVVRCRIDGRASPHQAMRKGIHIKSCDYAEVVSTAAKGPVEIGVTLSTRVDNTTIC